MNLKKLISKHPRRSEINSKKSLSHWKTCELIDFCVQLGIDFTQYISTRQSSNRSTLLNVPSTYPKITNPVNNVNTSINLKEEKPFAVKYEYIPRTAPCEHMKANDVKHNYTQTHQREEKNAFTPSILDAMSQFLIEQSDLLTMSFSLTINVNVLIGGNSVDFLMDDQSSIAEIKERVSSLYEIPLSSLHLLHNNRLVKDDTKILNLASNLYLQLRLITSVSIHYNSANGSDRVLKCYDSCCIFEIQKKICEIEEIAECKVLFNEIDISNAEYEIGKIVNRNCYSLSVTLKVIYTDKSNLLEHYSHNYYLNTHHHEEEDIFSSFAENNNRLFDQEFYCYFNDEY